MDDSPEAVAARLEGMDRVQDVWALAERRLTAGDAAFVADLGIAMWQRYGRQPVPPWQYHSAFDRMLRLLTLQTPAVDEALRLISVTLDPRRVRFAAALLASAHTPADLAPVLDGAGSDELRACVLHELVVRGAEVQHRPVGQHPLHWLPRSLTPLEGRPELPFYSINGRSHGTAGITVPPAPGDGPAVPARETTTDADAAALGAAVANWADWSNGRVEARTFALDGDLHPDAVGATLLGLGLESVPGLRQQPGPCTAHQAWRQLFLAASTGGAYNAGDFGAYGRLFAWRSVAALAGAPSDASPAGVESVARAASWHSFAGATDWFDDVAWDVGLAVVSPDGRRLAVLAASDTD
ncbi:DUF6183 family protein [Dactylosporangium cerinum]|uniref:DUF6183 family protein n=1 Tax=Dactylosporangium cerinum TaxID=1434730 RepID=A0ABV9W7X4_9ACTN